MKGGPLALIAYILNGQVGEPDREDWRLAFEEARKFLGFDNGEVNREAIRVANEAARKRRAAVMAKEVAQVDTRQDNARELWAAGTPLDGTAAETYLRVHRCINVNPWPAALRFLPRLRHDLEHSWHPALICRVDDVGGEQVGLWRIYLSDVGTKARVDNVRLGLGPVAGGAVRLFAPTDDGLIGVAEGVETALSVVVLGSKTPMWAALSTAGIVGLQVPCEVTRVRIYPDPDPIKHSPQRRRFIDPSENKAAAEKLAERLTGEGIRASVQFTGPGGGGDYNDALRSSVERQVAQARRAPLARDDRE